GCRAAALPVLLHRAGLEGDEDGAPVQRRLTANGVLVPGDVIWAILLFRTITPIDFRAQELTPKSAEAQPLVGGKAPRGIGGVEADMICVAREQVGNGIVSHVFHVNLAKA